MKCKHCQAELEEGVTLCPVCGKNQEESAEETAPVMCAETEEQPVEEQGAPEIKEGIKATPGKIALAVAAVVVLLAVLVAVIISGIDNGSLLPAVETEAAPTETVAATEEAVSSVIYVEPGTDYPSYTVTDDEARAAVDTVVATMGDAQLTNGELQVYYWLEVISFLQEYGGYADVFGMDPAHPLDGQVCEMSEEPMTWQQYFLELALDTWRSYQAMNLEGNAAGFQLSSEDQEYLSSIKSDLSAMAAEYGFQDAEALVAHNVGPGSSVDAYLNYMNVYYYGYMFYNNQVNNIDPTDEEVEQYYAENEAYYAEAGITKDAESYYVNVRHILLEPEGGTLAEDGYTMEYSEDEWESCRIAAQELLDAWADGEATEESFAALANEHSTDPGSNTNGGLYEGVAQGDMVEAFDAWCFDETRQAGDTGLVQTNYGYHIMYFSGRQDVWYVYAEYDFISDRAAALVPAAMEKYPAEIDYNAVKLGFIDLMGE